ncbi:hypothetical protein [Lentibacillus sediminis]|nr:hypothetical protein [Lentibacillus sediminis]
MADLESIANKFGDILGAEVTTEKGMGAVEKERDLGVTVQERTFKSE